MARIQRVNIEQQLAEIGVTSTRASMNITQPRMRMNIKTENPRMEIEKKAPTFHINRKKVMAESGLKGSRELSRDFSGKGKAAAMRSARTAKNDGNFLGETRNPGDRVGQLARNKAMERATRKKDFNIGLMPQSSPEVEWDKGHMRINWSKHSIVIDWDGEYMPQLTVDPKHSVEVFLRTEPYFRIMVEEVLDPGMPGANVDRAI